MAILETIELCANTWALTTSLKTKLPANYSLINFIYVIGFAIKWYARVYMPWKTNQPLYMNGEGFVRISSQAHWSNYSS